MKLTKKQEKDIIKMVAALDALYNIMATANLSWKCQPILKIEKVLEELSPTFKFIRGDFTCL